MGVELIHHKLSLGLLVLIWFSICISNSVSQKQAETPPRGWNSYDSYTWIISEKEFLANCEAQVKKKKSFLQNI